jgi:hypothetical protein
MDRLLTELDQTYFPDSVDELVVHLEHGPLGRPRASLVRNYVIVLLKELLSPIPSPNEPTSNPLLALVNRQRMKGRIIATLQAVACMHREVTFTALAEKFDELVGRADDVLLGDVLELCSPIPELWLLLSQAQKNRMSRFVQRMPSKRIPWSLRAAWSVPELREIAVERLSNMDSVSWKALSQVQEPPLEWIALAVDRLRAATSWSEANPIKEFLMPCAHLISEDQVIEILCAAVICEGLRTSWGVKDVLWTLVQSQHLGPGRVVELITAAGLADTYRGEAWWPKADAPQQSA